MTLAAATRGSLVQRAVWWAADYAYAAWRQLAVLAPPWGASGHRGTPRAWARGSVGLPEVILLPGVYEHWTFLRPLANALNADGYRVRVVHGLGANTRDIVETAERLGRALARTPPPAAGRVLIAHSKGGLIGKHLLIASGAAHAAAREAHAGGDPAEAAARATAPASAGHRGAARRPADQPGAGQPGAGRPGAERPGAGQPEAGRPEAGLPRAGHPAADQPDPDQPGADDPAEQEGRALGVIGMVAVCTPFGGSPLARLVWAPSIRAFLPSDATIVSLGRDTSMNGRIVSVFGRFDPHIPGGSALDGATNVLLSARGHFRILGRPETYRAVRDAIALLSHPG
ncbi:esterase/lipase family protein [Microbacterium rhizomatis]|uniref:esterase/lipase family protein n=1 Tax=Microbacterium rhizomatis TaxID=1631477 RepID=UPI001B8798FA|nr:hypothetical protein [Microbacterium rhizomatis]